jgi:two-component system alkaline phosphatase synthesis response regulator PhoP
MAKKKILVIDDEKTFGQMVKLNLEEAGAYEVSVETEGVRALEVARQFGPDLIFLDIVMPDMDGGEIARRIKMDERLKSVPIVFLTAVVREGEKIHKEGVIAGHPHPCIAKPVTAEKLINCIKKYLPT